MAIAFDKANSNVEEGISGTTSTVAVPTGGIAAGALVVVAGAHWDGACVLSSVADARGNTYSTPLTKTSGADVSSGTAHTIVTTPLQAGDLITLTWSIDEFAFIISAFCSYTGIDQSAPLDQHNEGAGTGTTLNSNSITTTLADELLIGVGASADDESWTKTASFTNLRVNASASDFLALMIEDRIVSATSSYTSTPSMTNSALWTSHILSFKQAASVTAQFLKPSADSNDGTWTDNAAGTALAAAIDEDAPADDTDYIQSVSEPQNAGCRVKLATGTDPASSTGHVIRWRIRKDAPGGSVMQMSVSLRQGGGTSLGGGTLIASRTRDDVDGSGWTTYEETLTGTEADTITDYADLYLEFYADVP